MKDIRGIVPKIGCLAQLIKISTYRRKLIIFRLKVVKNMGLMNIYSQQQPY